MPLSFAIGLLVIGILLGCVFTFGMQYWNAEVTRESCTFIETRFLAYDEIRQQNSPTKFKEIAIDCANGERYFIDGVSINTELRNTLSALSAQENITLLIHPNSNTIVELSNENGKLMMFEDSINQLNEETTGFVALGLFMYFCSLVGLYYVVLHVIHRRNAKK